MTILSLPGAPGFAGSRFGLVSNTTTFQSPLTGQTQTLERPGARWQAFYRLPPMRRAEATAWQSFLLQLRGGAGRFYGYDPDARVARGSALVSSTDTRNALRNGDAVGAVAGVIGSGGVAPTNWAFNSPNGLTREVIGSGVESGVSYVEVRFSGTPTVTTTVLSFESTTAVAVAEGETWAGSFFYRQTGGSMTNIAALNHRFEQMTAGGSQTQTQTTAVAAPGVSWQRAQSTRTLSDTTPNTERLRNALVLTLTVGLPIDITLRVGNCQLEKQASVTIYIPTSGTARSRGSGARVDGSGQGGAILRTWNWQPSQTGVLKAGDYVAVDTAVGRALHLVVADASSDSDGRASLSIEPPLRAAPADNAPLLLSAASAVMGLVEDSVAWEADAAGTYRLSFSAEERF